MQTRSSQTCSLGYPAHPARPAPQHTSFVTLYSHQARPIRLAHTAPRSSPGRRIPDRSGHILKKRKKDTILVPVGTETPAPGQNRKVRTFFWLSGMTYSLIKKAYYDNFTIADPRLSQHPLNKQLKCFHKRTFFILQKRLGTGFDCVLKGKSHLHQGVLMMEMLRSIHGRTVRYSTPKSLRSTLNALHTHQSQSTNA
jgi:hypothetical protein